MIQAKIAGLSRPKLKKYTEEIQIAQLSQALVETEHIKGGQQSKKQHSSLYQQESPQLPTQKKASATMDL